MINPSNNSVNSSISAAKSSGAAVSPVRTTFQQILSDLKTRPLQPLAVQRFAGALQRSLAQQVFSDTVS